MSGVVENDLYKLMVDLHTKFDFLIENNNNNINNSAIQLLLKDFENLLLTHPSAQIKQNKLNSIHWLSYGEILLQLRDIPKAFLCASKAIEFIEPISNIEDINGLRKCGLLTSNIAQVLLSDDDMLDSNNEGKIILPIIYYLLKMKSFSIIFFLKRIIDPYSHFGSFICIHFVCMP